jgi:hypothetical protein
MLVKQELINKIIKTVTDAGINLEDAFIVTDKVNSMGISYKKV